VGDVKARAEAVVDEAHKALSVTERSKLDMKWSQASQGNDLPALNRGDSPLGTDRCTRPALNASSETVSKHSGKEARWDV
jgi:hypothetical protein